jgi:hypothetical protein
LFTLVIAQQFKKTIGRLLIFTGLLSLKQKGSRQQKAEK